MYLKSLQNLLYHGWISKQDLLRLAVKETRLNSSKDDFLTEVHKKKTEHSFKLSLFICVF